MTKFSKDTVFRVGIVALLASTNSSPSMSICASKAPRISFRHTLDDTLVIAVELLAYDAGATYDLLPAGGSGLYWANGVLLKSTLAPE